MNTARFEQLLNNTVVPSNISLEEQEKRYAPIISYVNANLPEQLYRFCKCTDNNLEAFLNDQIWVSAAKYMNDGFDARIFFDIDVVRNVFSQNTKAVQNYIESFLASTDAAAFTKEIAKKALFSEVFSTLLGNTALTRTAVQAAPSVLFKEVEKILEGLSPASQEMLKFASFTEKLNSPMMWGLYAGDESGFAVAYHFDRMSFSAQLSGEAERSFSLYPIVYSNKRFEIPFDYVRFLAEQSVFSRTIERMNDSQMRQIGLSFLEQHARNCPDGFLFTKIALHKSSEWVGESEWRVLCNVRRNDSVASVDKGYFIKKPAAVYLGRRIHAINERLIRSIAEEKGIPCYKMRLNDKSPAYELVAERL